MHLHAQNIPSLEIGRFRQHKNHTKGLEISTNNLVTRKRGKVGFIHVKLERQRIAGGSSSTGENKLVGECKAGKVPRKSPGLAGTQSSGKGKNGK